MEHRVAQLEEQLTALITRFLPPILERLEKLEAGQTTAPAPATRKRKPLTAETYDMVKYLSKHGRTDREISEELKIPYTTVRAYIRLTPERVTKLRHKQLDDMRLKASEEDAVAAEVEAPSPEPEAAPEAVPEVSQSRDPQGIHLGLEMVQDDYEGAGTPLESQAINEPYEVVCDPSPSPFGEAGWWEWPLEYKQFAAQHKQDDGYPVYYPVERNTILTVQYMNEDVQKGVMSQDVDWTLDGGVLRWKIASL